jgi:hypothetical protein
MQIWKFQLDVTDIQSVMVPIGGELLSVGEQSGSICLWFMVDPDARREMREFEIVGTGNPMEPDVRRKFVGTVQLPPFVWHIFEAD